MKILKMFKAAFSVYYEWDGSQRPSKQLITYTVIFWGSVMTYFFDWKPFDEASVVAVATAVMSLLGSALRIESKGGESVIKPKVREKKTLDDEMKAYERSLMPEFPGE